jgi:hypothetical protein
VAINKNHEFEDLNGIKCAIIERNVLQDRVDFLKALLEYNGFTVVVVDSPPPKAAAKPAAAPTSTEATSSPEIASPPPTFTVGVTDVTFNPTNAIFGRSLKTKAGHVVTLAYWEQKENISHDEIPYFEDKNS